MLEKDSVSMKMQHVVLVIVAVVSWWAELLGSAAARKRTYGRLSCLLERAARAMLASSSASCPARRDTTAPAVEPRMISTSKKGDSRRWTGETTV